MKHISKSIIGRRIKCPRCENMATVEREDNRYYLYCVSCQSRPLLKELHQIKESTKRSAR